jgi:hypothetical protein
MPDALTFVGCGTIFVATLVLRFATIALLRRMEEEHTVLWSARELPESEAQRGPYRAPGVDWRVQRFIWSKDPAETGDPIVERGARIIQIGTILLVVGFVILIAHVR